MALLNAVRIQTTLTPDVVIDDPFAPGPPNFWLQLLKPKITLSVMGQPVVVAPYGDPGDSAWPWLKWATLVAAGGIGYLAVRGLLR